MSLKHAQSTFEYSQPTCYSNYAAFYAAPARGVGFTNITANISYEVYTLLLMVSMCFTIILAIETKYSCEMLFSLWNTLGAMIPCFNSAFCVRSFKKKIIALIYFNSLH
jgi:hypothetical protein